MAQRLGRKNAIFTTMMPTKKALVTMYKRLKNQSPR